MSQLPSIDYQKVAQRVASEYGNLIATRATLEILAEELRTERDAARAEVDELRQKLAEKVNGGAS